MNENTINFIDLPQIISACGDIVLPGSKSISNRILLLAALTNQKITIQNLLLSDDTNYMLDALKLLGVKIEKNNQNFIVFGCNGNFANKNADLFLGNAGTALRSLTAVLALADGNYTLSGVARMHQRPILDLLEPLQKLGANITELQNKGFPPLKISPFEFNFKNCVEINVNANISSQYLSALLIAIPTIKHKNNENLEILLKINGTLISSPYISMTLNLLSKFGIKINTNFFHENSNIFFQIPINQNFVYSKNDFFVEGDASSASYFLAMGAISKNPNGVKVIGVGKNSIQGDIIFANILQQMGANVVIADNFIQVRPVNDNKNLKPLCVDCLKFPDAAMTLAVLAMFCDYQNEQQCFILKNIDSWKVKETDRILAMQQELAKFDFIAEWNENFHELKIYKKHSNENKNENENINLKPKKIDTYDDHRMAMCFSLAAFATPLRINEPNCVAKTYPNYFDDFKKIAKFAPIIAIDGPSASGKGSVASAVAEILGFHYLDSGALYRISALAAQKYGIDLIPENAQKIADLITNLSAENKIKFSTRNNQIFLENQNISTEIRSENIGKLASKIATYAEIRNALLFVFRNFRKNPGLVADGRDMGSVVFADANVKIILTASAEIRAKRRFLQLQQQGFSVSQKDFQKIYDDLCQRDKSDKERKIAPLKSSNNAVEINSDNLTLNEVVEKVLQIYNDKNK